MKKAIFLITTSILILACTQRTKSSDNHDQQGKEQAKSEFSLQDSNITALSNLFTLADAEKILGESAHLADSLTNKGDDVIVYQSAYKANTEDTKSGKTGAIYFLAEKYSQVESAQKKYSFIKMANEKHEGIKALENIGDEAYFHSDGQNFYFVMVRKGVNVFNMKVNKITGTTSLDEFNKTAERIAASI